SADQVQAVIPVAGSNQGQTVWSGLERVGNRPTAVLEDRANFERRRRHEVGFRLALLQNVALQEWYDLLEDRGVSSHPHVLRGYVGEPEQVVGDARSDARTGLGMPPMLDVAFPELTRGGRENLLASEVRRGVE